MTAKLVIAPVKRSILVNAPQARAFEVFTAGIDRWWPRSHHIGTSPMVAAFLEPQIGGRFYMTHANGEEITSGTVVEWDAPRRIVFSWDINADWKPDRTVSSEVEVNFIAEGPAVTRVELEHRKFEALGAEAGAKMADGVGSGWPTLLAMFKTEVEKED